MKKKELKKEVKEKTVAKKKAETKKPENNISAEMKKLLLKKTPDAYVDFAIKSQLSPSEKRQATRLWTEKAGFTIDDINYARNRHPYWKKVKMKGSAERTKSRMEKYDFSKGTHKKWGKDELKEFLDLNKNSADFELAEKFQCSIPSIQGVRRLFNLAVKIIDIEGGKKTKTALLQLMMVNEKALRTLYQEKSGTLKPVKKKK